MACSSSKQQTSGTFCQRSVKDSKLDNNKAIELRIVKTPFKFPIQYATTHPDLSDLAALLYQRGRLKKLSLDEDDLVFFGSYNHTNYHDIEEDDDEPLRRDIFLSDLETSAADPLIVRFPRSKHAVVANLEVPVSSKKHKFTMPHSTGTWFMLLEDTRQNWKITSKTRRQI
ncbi:6474_t:CDS:2 [Paraglomus occultum]|uniref:6474_t:CDS:1 n=1 Tax=Paraglomus occultum TaxID=144539 RepID=A0A9N9GRL5_9GLOM|nr:6474_t:CDS:2 [Paraglomus occultum]